MNLSLAEASDYAMNYAPPTPTITIRIKMFRVSYNERCRLERFQTYIRYKCYLFITAYSKICKM